MQLLTRHYARKHMSGERLFECSHCGLKFATSNDCGSHQKLCLRGDNAGKVIRCDACGEEFTLAKVRVIGLRSRPRLRLGYGLAYQAQAVHLPYMSIYLP